MPPPPPPPHPSSFPLCARPSHRPPPISLHPPDSRYSTELRPSARWMGPGRCVAPPSLVLHRPPLRLSSPPSVLSETKNEPPSLPPSVPFRLRFASMWRPTSSPSPVQEGGSVQLASCASCRRRNAAALRSCGSAASCIFIFLVTYVRRRSRPGCKQSLKGCKGKRAHGHLLEKKMMSTPR